jgi:hypothetical protein
LDQRPWYVDFFDGDYLRIFGPVLPSERTAAEVNGVVERLGLPPGARLLDRAAGQGRRVGLEAMLGRAGLELLAVHGDLDGGPLELDSSFLVTLSGRAGKAIG